MKNRKLYLVAYDFSGGSQRRHALALCREHATGGQKSAHECWLTEQEHRILMKRLNRVIRDDNDSVFSVSLDQRQQVFCIGSAVLPLDPEGLFLV